MVTKFADIFAPLRLRKNRIFRVNKIEKVAVKRINIQRRNKHDGDSIKTKADSTYLESIIGKQQFTKLEKGIAHFHAWCILPENLNRLEEWVRSSK